MIVALKPGLVEISGLTAGRIGEEAAANSIVLHELTPVQATLEEAFMELTHDAVEFQDERGGEAPRTTQGASA